MVTWQYTVLTKGDGLLITAGEREGKGEGSVTAKPRRACGDTDREKEAQCTLKWEKPRFFPVLSAFFSTCFCSSPPKYSYEGFSLTLPFSREVSVLPLQLVSLASKNPAALSVQMTYLLHPDLCLPTGPTGTQ